MRHCPSSIYDNPGTGDMAGIGSQHVSTVACGNRLAFCFSFLIKNREQQQLSPGVESVRIN
jgi:hypothetical protein